VKEKRGREGEEKRGRDKRRREGGRGGREK